MSVYTILYVWILIFLVHYAVGPKGLMYARSLGQMNEQLEQELASMRNEIIELQTNLEKWHKIPFLKEQLAREQLQLVYPGDTVYYIT